MTVLFTISCWILREIFSFICFQDTALPWFSFFVVFLLCITYYFLSKTSEPFLRVQVRRITVPFGTQQFFQAEIYWPLTGLLKTTIYSFKTPLHFPETPSLYRPASDFASEKNSCEIWKEEKPLLFGGGWRQMSDSQPLWGTAAFARESLTSSLRPKTHDRSILKDAW